MAKVKPHSDFSCPMLTYVSSLQQKLMVEISKHETVDSTAFIKLKSVLDDHMDDSRVKEYMSEIFDDKEVAKFRKTIEDALAGGLVDGDPKKVVTSLGVKFGNTKYQAGRRAEKLGLSGEQPVQTIAQIVEETAPPPKPKTVEKFVAKPEPKVEQKKIDYTPEELFDSIKNDAFPGGLNTRHMDEAKKYSQMSSMINTYLRTGEFTGQAADRQWMDDNISSVRGAFDAVNPLTKEVTVFRGLESYDHLFKGKNPKDLIGQKFGDKGFVSTTTSEDTAFGWVSGKIYDGSNPVIFKIDVGTGTKAIPIKTTKATAYGQMSLNEILLNENSNFEITEVIVHENGNEKYTEIRCKTVSKDEKTVSSAKPKVKPQTKKQTIEDDAEAYLEKLLGHKLDKPKREEPKVVKREEVNDGLDEYRPSVSYKEVESSRQNVKYAKKIDDEGTLHKQLLNDLKTDFTNDEKSALVEYARNGFKSVNAYLRSGEAEDLELGGYSSNTTKGILKDLKSMFDKAKPLADEITVYRGMPDARSIFGKSDPMSFVGKSIRDGGYVSTSVNENLAASFMDGDAKIPHIMFKMKIGKGSTVIPIKGQVLDEQEILLPAGAEFKIKTVKKKKANDNMTVDGDYYEVELEYVIKKKISDNEYEVEIVRDDAVGKSAEVKTEKQNTLKQNHVDILNAYGVEKKYIDNSKYSAKRDKNRIVLTNRSTGKIAETFSVTNESTARVLVSAYNADSSENKQPKEKSEQKALSKNVVTVDNVPKSGTVKVTDEQQEYLNRKLVYKNDKTSTKKVDTSAHIVDMYDQLDDAIGNIGLTNKESSTIHGYIVADYEHMNDILRKKNLGGSVNRNEIEDVLVMQDIFEKKSKPLPNDINLKRVVSLPGFKSMSGGDVESMIGKSFTDLGFTSTTYNEDFALLWTAQGLGGEDFVMMNIKAPRGQHALHFGKEQTNRPERKNIDAMKKAHKSMEAYEEFLFSDEGALGAADQCEVVLPPNTKYKVVGIIKKNHPVYGEYNELQIEILD